MGEIKDLIKKYKIVPVIKLNDASDAAPLSDALCAGGLPVAEVTFRTDAAAESIRVMANKHPEMLIGAGTVTKINQVKEAIESGAVFIVTAGFNREVTKYCVENDIPIFPGVCTPSEMMWLLEFGLDVAKFFPAEQYGGLNTIKALAAPFPQMSFMPTGGINEGNIKDYLAFPKVIACGGSWMVKDDLINNGAFDEIAELTKKAVELVK